MHLSYLKNIALLFLILVFHHTMVAQPQQLSPFHKIDEENGLSDNNITCIFQDKRDFMWIGSSSGLNLINGSEITVFKNIPGNKNTISNNTITCITEDNKGILWIGTRNGLNALNLTLQKFNLILNEDIRAVVVNKNNNLYIGTGRGLFFYDQRKKSVRLIDIPGERIEKGLDNNISHIAFDKYGTLWIATFNGLWSYHENTGQFNHAISKENNPQFPGLFTTFLVDHAGNLWLGTWDSGLKEYNPQTKKVITYQVPENNFNILNLAEISRPDGSYNILLNGGEFYFNPLNNHFFTASISALESSQLTLYYKGDNKMAWIGTRHGLFYYKSESDYCQYLRFNAPITSQDVVVNEWNHYLLIGGSGQNFLKLYNKQLVEKVNYSNYLKFGNAECLTLQSPTNNWVTGGTSKGIFALNLISHQARYYHLRNSPDVSKQLEFISALKQDSHKNWWIFPWRSGIWMTDSNMHHPRKVFTNFLMDFGIPKPLVISAACEDQNGNMWMSDYDEGIIFYNRKTNRFSKPFIGSLGSLAPCSQIIYYKGNCFSFTASSLMFWNADSMKLHIVRLFPVTDKDIQSIAIDSAGHVWMATYGGLIAYNIQSKSLMHFTTADGIPVNKMNGTLFCCADGSMVFGNPEYIFSFQPETMLKRAADTPQIQLYESKVNGLPFAYNPSGKNYFNHNLRNFQFKWAVTDYKNPLENRYYYMLKGIDSTWRFAGKSGKVEFANLSPADYTLLLKGKNVNGVDANKILQIHFIILAPFWNRWWFFVLITLLTIAFFYSLYLFRLNQLLKLKNLRDRISLNLHDDIGSTLSSISILSDMVLNQPENPEKGIMLQEIKENSIAMMERMDDIVWSINPKNDSLENLFARIKSFAARLFEAKEINYHIEISNNLQHVHLDMEHRQHIYLIMKEAINNIVKYANGTEAKIFISYTPPLLSIDISDNGNGFDISNQSNGNGLINMKKRSTEIGAHLTITSKINVGTRIKFVTKIK